ncbi:hypothetical protein MMC34_007050 [Xylographa carneopallida]|nr:hypothetical protein [Xylographa carneopallida]
MDPGSPLQEGPTSGVLPSLPEGWLAQWEATSKKYYYVQRATGHSQWEIPTQPALSVPTPEPTPQHADTDPFQAPSNPRSGEAGTDESYEGADRGFLSDLAMNAVMGGKHNKPPSGLGGLASSFLGGQSSHNNNSGGNSNSGNGGLGRLASSFLGGQSSHNNNSGGSSSNGGGGGGLTGQLMGSLLGGGKPQQPQSSTPSNSTGATGGPGNSTASSHQSGGLMGMASGFLGNHQKPQVSHK